MTDNELFGTRSFGRQITSADGVGIIEILNCATVFSPYSPLEYTYFVERSLYLETLSGAVSLTSKQEAPFPDIYPEMSSAEKLTAFIKVEKAYPIVGLRFHINSGGTWRNLSTALLQNRGRETTIPFVIPYLTTNTVKLLSPTDRLGVSIINYGSGTLGNGDYINLEGEYRFSVSLIRK